MPLTKGEPPSSFDHSMIADIETRLYLLDYAGWTAAIEIQVVDPSRKSEYVAVAESLTFDE